MKKQQFTRTLFGVIFITILGFSNFAIASGGHGHAGTRSDGGRDHGGDVGEQNNDNELQSGSWSSEAQNRPSGTNLDAVRAGQPGDYDDSYNQSREFLRERQ